MEQKTLLIQIIALFNIILLTNTALTTDPNSMPLTSCYRRCGMRNPNCHSLNDNKSHQCQLMITCIKSCYGEYLSEHRDYVNQRREYAVNNNVEETGSFTERTNKRAVYKRACLSQCDADRYMCFHLSDTVRGVFSCNLSNNMCRSNCA
uniref:Uncharacterized protein n=1 Tax=Clytia hemisphaerica TaxID=252671 RepID=A0A7M5X7Q1_9CNID